MSRLLEFVRSGALGPIRVGATRGEVQSALELPDQWTETGSIWKYGAVELHFIDERVWMIFSDDPSLAALAAGHLLAPGVELQYVRRTAGERHVRPERDGRGDRCVARDRRGDGRRAAGGGSGRDRA